MIMNFYSLEVQKQVIQDLVACQKTARLLGLNDLLNSLQNEVDRFSKIFRLHNEIDSKVLKVTKNGVFKNTPENEYLKECIKCCFSQLQGLL